jgi:hypothetical protein
MITDIVPLTLLLLVGVVALVLAVFLAQAYLKDKGLHHLFWAVSFLVLFVSGVLIILNDFIILEEPLVPVVAALIPACLAIGLLYALYDSKPWGLYYAMFALVMILLLAIVRLDLVAGLDGLSSGVLMGLHIPSGLIISFLPLYAAFVSKSVGTSGALFGIGGLLMSVGGVLLAFVAIGSEILSKAQIFEILPLLLVIVVLFLFFGIILPEKWKIDIPIISGSSKF